ncbi:hypothetical protein [Qipengyuania sp. DGS5-3]|uniref:hypothetical protein n=1 Tax=Qipengyuania sp. DGS5-3 TaxID=3349632 RepID=UPI0036D2974E
MSDTSFASLCPTLLARKGGAKPAMRPQLGMLGKPDGKLAAANLEDLGWNDMGDAAAADASDTNVVSLNADNEQTAFANLAAQDPATDNPVQDSLEQLSAQIEKTKRKRKSATVPSLNGGSKRAAFTLRLDAERHLRLRLASTIRNCSAQQFVTEALDAMLDNMPEIDGLAAQVQRS